MTKLLGLAKTDYDTYVGCVFINEEDYLSLYDKGNFQISAFMESEGSSETTIQTLKQMGYRPLSMKSVLSTQQGSFDFINRLINRVVLVVLFVVLFFIAYAVIRLIMRSRNTYYSTLRILGASRANTASLLRIELLTVMTIASGLMAGFIYLVSTGRLDFRYVDQVREYLRYMQPQHYAILYGVILLMTLLICRRYSRKIFGKSAMGAIRGEV